MKFQTRLWTLLFILGFESLSYVARAQEAPDLIAWRTPSQGMAEALKTRKPILFDVTAQWCGVCKMLKKGVFTDPACAKIINGNFIPVRVMDRAREEGKNPVEVAAFENRYKIQGFPTLIVQYADQNVYRKIAGYYGKGGTMRFLYGATHVGK